MLEDLEVPFQCLQADELGTEAKTKAIHDLKAVNPKCSFPTIVVDDKVIVGYKIQEIKETIGIRTEVDDLYDTLKKINEPKGYFLNGDKEKAFELIRSLINNKKKYGYMACPCRLPSGNIDNDRDIICPCIYRQLDIEEFGSCFCSLYVSADWYTGKIERVDIPERRPPELYQAE
jgi:ferredoxin-thioredoxin reductase catalytic subunit